jgi:hypothetical protein
MVSRERPERVGMLGVGAAAVAVLCCAALPFVAGVIASIGIGAAIGVGAGGLAVVAAVAATLAVVRARRRSCRRDPSAQGPHR